MDHLCGPIFRPFFSSIFEPLNHGGGRPLVLREGWDAVYQYPGRGARGRQTFVTKRGVEEELLVRREGWEVAEVVDATD